MVGRVALAVPPLGGASDPITVGGAVGPGKVVLHAPGDTCLFDLVGTDAKLQAEDGNTKALGPFVTNGHAL